MEDLHLVAGQVLEKLDQKKGTINNLILGDPGITQKRAVYAIVVESLKYKDVINELIKKSGVIEKEKKAIVSRYHAQALIYDLVFANRKHKPRRHTTDGWHAIRRQKPQIMTVYRAIKEERGVTEKTSLMSDAAKKSVLLPRYVRVSTNKTDTQTVIDAFQRDGFNLLDEAPEDLANIGKNCFCRDPHVSDLLVFPPRIDLHKNKHYIAGEIVLQDKASCFPAFICNPHNGAHVIDTCAAPGNKTSHLSALMKNSGKIWAFDLDSKRLLTLKRLTEKAGCTNIEPVNASFLDVDPNDPTYAEVEYLLVDPSCSGSGLINRYDELLDQDKESNYKGRLRKLAEFQIAILQHALKFPKAKRVVYSTCSIHAEENEQVIKEVLASNPEFDLAPRSSVMPSWPRRGLPNELGDKAECVIRADPRNDFTTGFFVACFERKVDKKASKRKTSSESNSAKKKDSKRKASSDSDGAKKKDSKRKAQSDSGGTKKKKKAKKE